MYVSDIVSFSFHSLPTFLQKVKGKQSTSSCSYSCFHSIDSLAFPFLHIPLPTLLTGDKSNSDVIAHEISHSWTGNLITNTNFEHFWLNEGFTVFIERKIKGRLKGEKERHFTTLLRWQELEECVFEEFNPEHEYTKLIPNLVGVDPDDAFCRLESLKSLKDFQ